VESFLSILVKVDRDFLALKISHEVPGLVILLRQLELRFRDLTCLGSDWRSPLSWTDTRLSSMKITLVVFLRIISACTS
jgi:hypothetical protein